MDLKIYPTYYLQKRGGEMFERFTESARQTVVKAHDEARQLSSSYVTTEHLLLSVVYMESHGAAPPVLASMGVTQQAIHDALGGKVQKRENHSQKRPGGSLPFSKEVERIFETSIREALGLGHNFVAVGHIVLAIVRENKGVAAEVLKELKVDPKAVREEIIESFSTPYDSMKALESHLKAAKVQIPFLKEQLPKDDTLKRGEFERIEENLVIAQERLEDVKHLDT